MSSQLSLRESGTNFQAIPRITIFINRYQRTKRTREEHMAIAQSSILDVWPPCPTGKSGICRDALCVFYFDFRSRLFCLLLPVHRFRSDCFFYFFFTRQGSRKYCLPTGMSVHCTYARVRLISLISNEQLCRSFSFIVSLIGCFSF